MSLMDICNGIQHIGIPTENLEKAKEFYIGLGFEVMHEKSIRNDTQNVAFLKSKNLVLEIYEGEPVKKDGAINHFAIDCQDIEKAYSYICENGYKVISDGIEELPFFVHGVRFFIIEGPDYTRVEFNQIL